MTRNAKLEMLTYFDNKFFDSFLWPTEKEIVDGFGKSNYNAVLITQEKIVEALVKNKIQGL